MADVPPVSGDFTHQRARMVERQLADIERRITRQIAAIETGVDPHLVGERIEALKSERVDFDGCPAC
jgi:hypothetical protein